MIQMSGTFWNMYIIWNIIIRLDTILAENLERKKEKQYECDLFREINTMCNSSNSNSPNIIDLQTKLDVLYLKRAYGAFLGQELDGRKQAKKFFIL